MSELEDYIRTRLNETYREKVYALPEEERWILTHCNFCGREKAREELTIIPNPFCGPGLGCSA